MKQGVEEAEKISNSGTQKCLQQSVIVFTMSDGRPLRWIIRLDLLLSIFYVLIIGFFFFVSENPVIHYSRSYHLL